MDFCSSLCKNFVAERTMNVKLFLVLVSSLWMSYGDERYRCPDTVKVNNYLKTHGGYCFEFVNRETNWYGANQDCQSKRGHLVVIHDEDTQKFLMRVLKDELHWPRNGVWIGASDMQREMHWKWVTNDLVRNGYSNWASGQPSCHIFCFEDCGLMRLDDGGKWHDYKCDWIEDYSYICQYPMRPKTTSPTTITTTTTPSTTSTTQISSTWTTTTTTIPGPISEADSPVDHLNSTENDTSVIVNLQPDVVVELNGNVHRSEMQQAAQQDSLDAGSTVGLILGLVCGICLGLCLGIFIFRRRNRKQKEELPTVVFANPYYAEARTPLRGQGPDDSGLGDCCFGGASSEASTPVKQPLCVDLNRMENIYDSDPTAEYLTPRLWGGTGAGQYDEIKPKVPVSASDHCPEDQGAYGGGEVLLWDNHYDYTTGENFYESVDNVRLAIEQNVLNEQQEDTERYVPFQFDSA